MTATPVMAMVVQAAVHLNLALSLPTLVTMAILLIQLLHKLLKVMVQHGM